ncbi:MAG: hypothetical protein L0H96_19845 [Humibacillus sp.]|nr:hypothetical protein [Humibacillus sp.]MDN5779150.1 hypothetical protein [Humibacillus sp.]
MDLDLVAAQSRPADARFVLVAVSVHSGEGRSPRAGTRLDPVVPATVTTDSASRVLSLIGPRNRISNLTEASPS